MNPKESPDFLALPGRGKGVRRLNRLPLIGVIILLLLAVAGISYTFIQRQAQMNRKASEQGKAKPVAEQAAAPVRPVGPEYVPPIAPPEPTEIPVTMATETKAVPIAPPPPSEAYLARMRLIQRAEENRLAAAEAALNSESTVAEAKADPQSKAGNEGNAGKMPSIPYPPPPGMAAPDEFGDQLVPTLDQQSMGDPNRQAEKRSFLANQPAAETYLTHTREAAMSPYEVKAGTIIPGVMIGGINSDLPGQIIAQVRESVYDSATGKYLLIPAGSRLIGTYDSSVTMGQRRVLVAWTRIIYPDSSSVSLDVMPGADQSGYAGFNDQVDNHYVRIFGNALMLSVIAAGVQLSQPHDNNINGGYSSQQIMAAELGRQLGQLGMTMTRRNMDIQPTLEIRPGYEFNVMVTKDMILTPWQGHPLVTASQAR
jgi:type IV secretory pathway VirB10-like protein